MERHALHRHCLSPRGSSPQASSHVPSGIMGFETSAARANFFSVGYLTRPDDLILLSISAIANMTSAGNARRCFRILTDAHLRPGLPDTLLSAVRAPGNQIRVARHLLTKLGKGESSQNVKPFIETLRVTNPVRQSRASSRKRVLRGGG